MDWKEVEKKIAKLTGGKLVKGSGNQLQQGDIITPSHLIEVKHTAKDFMDIRLQWLSNLERHDYLDLILVVSLNGKIFPFFAEQPIKSNPSWKSIKFTEEKPITTLQSRRYTWELRDEEALKEIKLS